MIKITDALGIMKQTTGTKLLPFSIVYVQADRARDKGGKVVELDKAYISNKVKSGSQRGRYIHIRPAGTQDFVRVHLDLILYINDQPIA